MFSHADHPFTNLNLLQVSKKESIFNFNTYICKLKREKCPYLTWQLLTKQVTYQQIKQSFYF